MLRSPYSYSLRLLRNSEYCQVVEKQFCVDLKRQKALIYSPWKGGGGYSPVPLVQIWKDERATNKPCFTT
jgi:hypothetical protein